MAIFRRDAPPTPPRPEARPAGERTKPPKTAKVQRSERPAPGGSVTLVAKGSRFVGKISGPAEVIIEGEVEGEVALDGHAQIGTNGRVRGNMLVKSARIAGQLVGNVKGREVVELTATGKLEGDVSAPRVIIAEGAFFRGNIEMTGKSPAAVQKDPAPATSPKNEPQDPGRQNVGPQGGGSQNRSVQGSGNPGGGAQDPRHQRRPGPR